jgi:hypothetical protein
MTVATHTCRTCGDPVPAVHIGRPRSYCSVRCRRAMEAMRRELPELEAAAVHARQMAESGHAPGPYSWNGQARHWELAAAELRVRIGDPQGGGTPRDERPDAA